MAVEDVDIVDAESSERLIEGRQQILAGTTESVGAGPHVPAGFGRDDQFLAVRREILTQDPAEVRLGASVRGTVVVRKIEVGDSEIECPPQNCALVLDRYVVAEVVPEAQRDGREFETAPTGSAVRHGFVAVLRGDVLIGHGACLHIVVFAVERSLPTIIADGAQVCRPLEVCQSKCLRFKAIRSIFWTDVQVRVTVPGGGDVDHVWARI